MANASYVGSCKCKIAFFLFSMSGVIGCPMNFESFPFDENNCEMTIASCKYKTYNLLIAK